MKSLGKRKYNFVVFVCALLIVFTTATSLSAWTGPTQAPPNGNVSAPVNVGTTDQVKNAGLSLNALVVFGNTLLSGVARYLNFGTTAGSGGYGLRDNAGVMQYKNSGGSWSAIGGASGPTPWLVSGTDVYYNGGDVGIGATNPAARLDVAGNTILSGSNRYLNFGTTADSSGYGIRDNTGTLQFKNSGGAWTSFASSTSGTSPWLTSGTDVYYNSGDVGIGTTNPGAKLDVVGSLRATNAGIGTSTNSYALNVGGASGGIMTSSLYVAGGGYLRNVSINDHFWECGSTVAAPGNGYGKTFCWNSYTDLGVGSITGYEGFGGLLLRGNSGGWDMFINSAGSVGIGMGTLAPAHRLDVNGRINASSALCIGGDCRTSWATAGDDLGSHVATKTLNMGGFNVTNSGTLITNEVRAASLDGHLLLEPRSGVLLIDGPTQTYGYMIVSGGDLDVYGAIHAQRQNNYPSIYVNNHTGVGIEFSPGDNSTTPLLFKNSSGTNVGSVTTNSSQTTYNTTSDYRIKENVAPLSGALDRLTLLKPSRFNFKIEPGTTLDGFLAHEVASIVPEAVTGTKDAVDEKGEPILQQLDMSKLIPLLTASIQELKAENDELRKELEDLKVLVESNQ